MEKATWLNLMIRAVRNGRLFYCAKLEMLGLNSKKLVYKDVTIDSKSYASWSSTSFTCSYSGYYQAFATIIGTTNSSYAVQFIAAPSCAGYWKLINTYNSALTVGFTIRCYFIKKE